MFRLSYKEIKERMIEWRNLKKLHANARETIEVQKELIKNQGAKITNLEAIVNNQEKLIENQALQIEELRRMVFGKKRKKEKSEDSNDDGSDNQPRSQAHRSPDSYHRPLPKNEDITTKELHPISRCNTCRHKLIRKTTISFYEEDIPLPIRKIVTKHTVEKGYCPKCNRHNVGLDLPSAKVILGKQTKIYVCYLSIILNLSFEKIKQILIDTYNLKISDGEISNILEKEATKLRPEYERLKKEIRSQPAVHYDETGWPVQEEIQGSFGWVMTRTDTSDTVFMLGQTRGKGVAEELKGNSNHIGITDDYVSYRNLFKQHQLCWAHPLRKLRDLSISEQLNPEKRRYCLKIYQRFKKLFEEVEKLSLLPIDQRKSHVQRLMLKFLQIAKPRTDDPDKLLNVKKALIKNKRAYFTCLNHENIPLTNNKAERALRPLVIKRKISFGSKTQAGAEHTSILASVLLSLWWKKPDNFFRSYQELRGV